MCTGEFVKHKGVEEFRILFFDSKNNSLSQMAEAIANGLRLPRFLFSSAGDTPRPIDPRTVEFMASKGLDVSRLATKSLEQVPSWEQYQVIIALGTQAQQAFSARHCKTILFTWSIPDPLEIEGAPETVREAFESAYQSLESHIRELVGAVLREPQPELKL